MANVKLIEAMSSSKSGIGTLWGKSIDKRIRRIELKKSNDERRRSHFNRQREGK